MTEVSFADLVVRSLLALAVVLAIVGLGYVVARRRSHRVGPIAVPRASSSASSSSPAVGRLGLPKRRPTPTGVEVIARAGLARNAAVVAVRFGDRVLLVSVADQAPNTLLAEMSVADWDENTTARDAIGLPSRTTSASNPASNPAPNVVSQTPSFLEAMRQATARRD